MPAGAAPRVEQIGQSLPFLGFLAFTVVSRCASAQFSKAFAHVLAPATLGRITTFTIWTVDSEQRQEVTNPTSQVHKSPAARSVSLRASKIRSVSANKRTRLMWGYAEAILWPLADWHGAPVDAPHVGHCTTLKLGFTLILVPACAVCSLHRTDSLSNFAHFMTQLSVVGRA